ncbi:TetR/AcrR family transcriptional regulator [Curtobacterium pusillum]|uniref:TetR/AcrR family transcriptional regulator n=1 Tax=Curtobacterium pusillum TaxID=69373 RepID=UPI00119C97BD|nr:TetR/AcrR family transcriptional regulator [Curtobacterium pusillum]
MTIDGPTRGGSTETEDRILEVALEVLGKDPGASMTAVATAAGVVRRTVYGYFPARSDLVLALTRRAAGDIAGALEDTIANDTSARADELWARFVGRLWPLTDRYRVLVTLRRGEFGEDIHALLRPVDRALADLVERGHTEGVFGRHLRADVLSQVAWSAVFAIADHATDGRPAAPGEPGARPAIVTSLLMLGVPEGRAASLADGADEFDEPDDSITG